MPTKLHCACPPKRRALAAAAIAAKLALPAHIPSTLLSHQNRLLGRQGRRLSRLNHLPLHRSAPLRRAEPPLLDANPTAAVATLLPLAADILSALDLHGGGCGFDHNLLTHNRRQCQHRPIRLHCAPLHAHHAGRGADAAERVAARGAGRADDRAALSATDGLAGGTAADDDAGGVGGAPDDGAGGEGRRDLEGGDGRLGGEGLGGVGGGAREGREGGGEEDGGEHFGRWCAVCVPWIYCLGLEGLRQSAVDCVDGTAGDEE